MKKTFVAVFLVLAAGAAQAGWDKWQSSRYSASFTEYDAERHEELDSTKGTTGGWWGDPAVPAGASAKAKRDSEVGVYMDCTTEGEGIAFTPYDVGDRFSKTVTTRIKLVTYDVDVMPTVPDGARAAFFACETKEGVVTFIGLGRQSGLPAGWIELYLDSEPEPEGGIWYDLSMKFIEKAGVVRVQYRLKNDKGVFEPLHSGSGETWFVTDGIPERKVASKVEYRGEGALQFLNGGEPARGLLLGLVPWREILVDETVYNHGTGTWAVYDPNTGRWMETPEPVGDAYFINVADGTDGDAFIPNEKGSQSGALKKVEFSVRFSAPNDNDAVPDDVSALVRIVEEPLMDLRQVSPTYRFAYLGGALDGHGDWHGRWYTNTTIQVDVDADYTVEVSQDDEAGTVSYRARRGRNGEGGAYQTLCGPIPSPVISPFYAFFGGHGYVYGIKSTGSEAKEK